MMSDHTFSCEVPIPSELHFDWMMVLHVEHPAKPRLQMVNFQEQYAMPVTKYCEF
jgi:hypothetical protein